MTVKKRSHSETAWERLCDRVTRCQGTRPNGGQCRREAEDGSVVCDQHGGVAPQVRRRAAERVMMTADAAAASMIEMMNDKSVPYGIRLKAMQDVLDRAGLGAKQVVEIGPKQADPVESLFTALLSDPANFAAPAPVVRGELVEPEPDPAQDALDRQAESWVEDAEVTPLRHQPDDYGPVGPHSMSPPSSAKVPRHIAEGLDLHPRRR